MPPVGFKPTIPASVRPQTHRMPTRTGVSLEYPREITLTKDIRGNLEGLDNKILGHNSCERGLRWPYVLCRWRFTADHRNIMRNVKVNTIRGLDRPSYLQQVEAPTFQNSRHIKAARLSALGTGRFIPRKYSWYSFCCGPGSSVGVATDYELDDPGIEFMWGRDFSNLSRPVLGPTQPPVQWVPGLPRG
jgi:hypothetical protein